MSRQLSQKLFPSVARHLNRWGSSSCIRQELSASRLTSVRHFCESEQSKSTKRLKIKKLDSITGGFCSSSDEEKDIKKPSSRKDEDDEDDDLDEDRRKNQIEDSEKAQKKAIYVTKLGAVANVGLAISKGMIGFSVASTALIADAANSLGDVLCDGVVYYTVTEARKHATPDRPWGRGKIEPLGALSVGGLLLATGVGIGYSAFQAGMDILQISSVMDLFSSLTGTQSNLVVPIAE